MNRPPPLPPGRRLLLSDYAESPEEAIASMLTLVEQPAPDPAALRPHEVLVRVRAAAVSWVDLLMTSGQYQHKVPPPYTPGMEYAGEVLAVGPAVAPAQVAVGDRVMADTKKVGPRSFGEYQTVGGLATYAVLPADGVIRVPGPLSFEQAAGLLQAYETAYHCLVARAKLQPGESILVLGATGLTGLAAVELAKKLGATVIAAGRSDERLAAAKAKGADHLLNIRGADGGVRRFREDVKALTGGEGVDVVYDAVGGEVSLEAMRCVAFGARFLIVGWTSTPNVAKGRGQGGAPNANMLPTNLMQMKQLTVMGCPSAIAVAKDPSIRPPRLAAVLGWAERGEIEPLVSLSRPLEEFREVMRARWKGEVVGACVLRP